MPADTVLVTGVGGLIGAAVAARLAAAGRPVLGMDRQRPPGFDLPFLSHDLPDRHRWHEAIVAHRIGRVVHAGGISGPMLLNDAPDRIVDINLNGLAGLLEAARIHRLARVVAFSSVVAYGERPGTPAITEDEVLRPRNIYGATKAAGDALIDAYRAEHGVDAVSFRVAGCYGPGRTTPCLIRMLIEAGLAGREALVREDPERTRQFVFVDDVASAVLAALDAPALGRHTYNIGPGVAHAASEVIDAVRRCVPGLRARIDPAGMHWNSFGLGVLDIAAARRDLGFEPKVGLAEGAARTLEWVVARGARHVV